MDILNVADMNQVYDNASTCYGRYLLPEEFLAFIFFFFL